MTMAAVTATATATAELARGAREARGAALIRLPLRGFHGHRHLDQEQGRYQYRYRRIVDFVVAVGSVLGRRE